MYMVSLGGTQTDKDPTFHIPKNIYSTTSHIPRHTLSQNLKLYCIQSKRSAELAKLCANINANHTCTKFSQTNFWKKCFDAKKKKHF